MVVQDDRRILSRTIYAPAELTAEDRAAHDLPGGGGYGIVIGIIIRIVDAVLGRVARSGSSGAAEDISRFPAPCRVRTGQSQFEGAVSSGDAVVAFFACGDVSGGVVLLLLFEGRFLKYCKHR